LVGTSPGIKYEDLARSPKDVVRDVLKFAGVEEGLTFFSGDKSVDLGLNHTVSGNPMRFKTGPIDIRHDDEWTRSMRPLDRIVASLITSPVRRRFYR
jgi:hypothetical protein